MNEGLFRDSLNDRVRLREKLPKSQVKLAATDGGRMPFWPMNPFHRYFSSVSSAIKQFAIYLPIVGQLTCSGGHLILPYHPREYGFRAITLTWDMSELGEIEENQWSCFPWPR